jgi:Ala-tRNA(Pro) deacylase
MATPDELLARLAALGIESHTVSHPPVFTVEEARRHRGQLEGTHVKNLFLRDEKGAMWLVVAHEDRALDLKALARRLGAPGKDLLRFLEAVGHTPRILDLGEEP